MWVYELDTFGILEVNQAAVSHYGYAREEFLSMSIVALRPTKEVPKLIQAHKDIESIEGNIHFGVFTHQKKDGSLIKVDINGHKVTFRDKSCVMVICQDVTQREEELLRLQLSEQKLAAASEIADIGYWRLEMDANTLTWSDKVYEIWGRKREDFLLDFNAFYATIHPQDLARFDREQEETFGGRKELNFPHRILLPDGQVRWVSEVGRLNRDASGRPISFEGIVRDITAEMSEQIQKDLFTKISEVFSTTDDLNPALSETCRMILDLGGFGFTEIWLPSIRGDKLRRVARVDAFSKPITGEASPVDPTLDVGSGLPGKIWLDRTIIYTEDASETASCFSHFEKPLTHKPAVFGVPLMYHEQCTAVLLVGNSDATPNMREYEFVFNAMQLFLGSEIFRKRMENDRLHMFESLPDLVAILDYQGNFITINSAGCNMLGYSESEIVGKPLAGFVYAGDIPRMTAALTTASKESESFKCQLRVINRQGQVVWLSWHCNRYPQEEIIYGSAKDITAEIKLARLSEEIADIAQIGSWELELTGQREVGNVYWSPMVRRILEVDEDYSASLTGGFEFYVGESKDRIRQAIDRLVSEGIEFDEELLIKTNAGREKWIRCIGRCEEVDGRPVKVFGSFQDIHTMKSTRNQLEEILGSISDAFYAVDENWNFTFFNKESENLLGRKSEDLIGKNIWEEFAPAKGTEIETIYKRVVASGKSERFEYFYPGTRSWYEVAAYPSGGGLSSYYRNIDSRIENERILMEAFEEKIQILESIGDAFFAVDNQWKVTYWNAQAEKFLFRNRSEMLGSNLWEKYPEAIDGTFYQKYHLAKQTMEVQYFEEYFEPLGRWFEVTAYPSKKGLSVYFKDVTLRKEGDIRLKEANETLLKYARDLEISNEQLEQFAFITSHDLQEPLRMITSFLNQLQRKYRDQLDAKAHQYIDFAVDGAIRMKQIILDVLEYSRAGKFEEEPERISLEGLLEEYKALRRKLLEDRRAVVTGANLPTIFGFKAPLTQTLHCLIDNAVKYGKKDVPPQVEIFVEEKSDCWQISVRDNGIGIEEKYFEKIFVIFQQLHSRGVEDGTGIGLPIVKKQVESWGGKIWVESEPGVGSTFFFTVGKRKTRQ
ncbi:two-component sensor histidine kinase [Lunatimonas lonarensis]|uniref:histidine kinase n=2 Tax=Lunatimonas lonarensis TaxID=1232681 RepID=R7ZS80_9BACT|nr:two-component sensor histidine kinase [Lunatimonas lonarensis]